MPGPPWLIVPTYDEAENLDPVVTAARAALAPAAPEGFRILVVDDASPDGTGPGRARGLRDPGGRGRPARRPGRDRRPPGRGVRRGRGPAPPRPWRAGARLPGRLRARARRGRRLRARDGRRPLARPRRP